MMAFVHAKSLSLVLHVNFKLVPQIVMGTSAVPVEYATKTLVCVRVSKVLLVVHVNWNAQRSVLIMAAVSRKRQLVHCAIVSLDFVVYPAKLWSDARTIAQIMVTASVDHASAFLVSVVKTVARVSCVANKAAIRTATVATANAIAILVLKASTVRPRRNATGKKVAVVMGNARTDDATVMQILVALRANLK